MGGRKRARGTEERLEEEQGDRGGERKHGAPKTKSKKRSERMNERGIGMLVA